MRSAGTVVAVIVALLWSVVIWGGYGFLLMSTSFVATNAGEVGLPPDVAGWAATLDGLLRNYGTGTAAVLWALGVLAILALRALLNLLVGGGRRSDSGAIPQPSFTPEVPAQPTASPTMPHSIAPPPAGPSRWGRDASR